MPSASAVVGDVVKIASGWYPPAFAQRIARREGEELRFTPALRSRFYLRINTLDVPGSLARIAGALAEHEISIASVVQHESAAGQIVPIVVVTHAADLAAMEPAVSRMEALEDVQSPVVYYRIVDPPRG